MSAADAQWTWNDHRLFHKGEYVAILETVSDDVVQPPTIVDLLNTASALTTTDTPQLPTISVQVHEIHVERDVAEATSLDGNERHVTGELTYTARTIAGDYLVIDRAEHDRIAAELAARP